ncbi:MAG TPA: protease modulator HflC [Gammaproteobacteria bacterium]|jgi:membrane protease subunit HflC|nr:protease modulator HflC [Gammaproteobacteria bacterium]
MQKLPLFLVAGILGVMLLASSVFVVGEREKAIKLALGEIDASGYTPGLHFRVPIYNTIHKFDSRILTLDAPPERVLTSEKKNLIVDSFVKWRIENVERFFLATGGDERSATTRLAQFIRKGVLDAFGQRTVEEVVSGQRAELMAEVRTNANVRAKDLGVEVVDVRVKRVDLPADVSDSVYQRMEKERATVAKAFRSRGEEAAKGIRADADRQRAEIIAEAYSESEQIRGEGDAKAAEVYADAFQQDEEFFRLSRSLKAYRSTFRDKNDILLLKPDSDFFKYFNDITARPE